MCLVRTVYNDLSVYLVSSLLLSLHEFWWPFLFEYVGVKHVVWQHSLVRVSGCWLLTGRKKMVVFQQLAVMKLFRVLEYLWRGA